VNWFRGGLKRVRRGEGLYVFAGMALIIGIVILIVLLARGRP
jgi:hypothetical protein